MPDEPINEQTAHAERSVQSTTSSPVDMTLDAPKASTNTVIPPSVKDDNFVQDVPESHPVQLIQTEPTAHTEVNPELKPEISTNPEVTPESGTAHIPPTDPIVSEPVSETKPESVQTDSALVSAEPTPVPVSSKPNLARNLLNKARQVIQNRKQKKINRILDLFAKRTNITNDEVEKFLHVSDATATRYLEILEKENKIKQSGKTGKGVSYSKI